MGTFFWPTNSTPERTSRALQAVGAQPSPLNYDAWKYYLQPHPDQVFVSNFLRTIKEGTCIGYRGPRTTFLQPRRTRDDNERNIILQEYLAERDAGRMCGPFTDPPTGGPFTFVRESPTFCIDKPGSSEKRRIDHLSYPPNNSVNSHIDKNDFPVNFANYDSVKDLLCNADPRQRGSKWDIRHAFRNQLVNPSDWPLLVSYCAGYWFSPYMTFGGSSFPGIFERPSKATEWIIEYWTDVLIRAILDDFLGLHSLPDDFDDMDAHVAREWRDVYQILLNLGWPIHPRKLVVNVSELVFLGVLWNIADQTMGLPQDKQDKYQLAVAGLLDASNNVTTIPTMRSILGKLVFTASIVPVGRSRLFHLFKCLRGAESAARRIYGQRKRYPGKFNLVFLTQAALDDVRWWLAVLDNPPVQRLILREHDVYDPKYIVTTDACNDGIGGYWYGSYFSVPLSYEGTLKHITFKELLALLFATLLWGTSWSGSCILWRTDCEAHVRGLFKIRTQAPELLPLHDMLDLLAYNNHFIFSSTHLPGVENGLADKLSRHDCSEAIHLKMQRCRTITNLPPNVSCWLQLNDFTILSRNPLSNSIEQESSN